MDILKKLFEMQDTDYKEFQARLIPNIAPDSVIGIRTPQLRAFAREFAKGKYTADFLNSLPHKYYDENNLHVFTIEQIKDFPTALYETKRFLPFIDNWATCDCFLPKIFKKHKHELLPEIYEWLKSSHTYTVRYALGLLMKLFLDEDFKEEYLQLAASIHSNEYYINMMIAWYFATALAKQYDAAIPYITEYRLDAWVHNKSIQKAVESRRISPETKLYLKGFRIKV